MGDFSHPNNNKKLALVVRKDKTNDKPRPDYSWSFKTPGEKRLTVPNPVVQVGRLPFGDRYLFRLPLVESGFIVTNGTTGLAQTGYTYRGNNMYDARVEVGGLQPMQYDLLASVYNAYRVFETHVKLTFFAPTGNGCVVGYRVRASSNPVATAGQDYSYLQEMDHVDSLPMPATGTQTRTFKFAYRTAAMVGCSETQAEDFQMGGLFSGAASPGITTLIEPFAWYNIAGDAPSVQYTMEITYVGVATERKTYPRS